MMVHVGRQFARRGGMYAITRIGRQMNGAVRIIGRHGCITQANMRMPHFLTVLVPLHVHYVPVSVLSRRKANHATPSQPQLVPSCLSDPPTQHARGQWVRKPSGSVPPRSRKHNRPQRGAGIDFGPGTPSDGYGFDRFGSPSLMTAV